MAPRTRALSDGDGNSETLIGEVMRTRRDECVLATKVKWEGMTRDAVIASVRASLERLQTGRLDIVQFHGGMFTHEEYEHIVGGPLEGLLELRRTGEIGFIGLTTEEPWTVRPFMRHDEFSVFQLAYNFIYQSAARNVLDDARRLNAGVVTMRTMTSGILQRATRYLAPEWRDARDIYEVCLKFVLSDSRVRLPSVASAGQLTIIETVNQPGFGPPLHRHRETEIFHLTSRRYLFEVDAARFHAERGDVVCVPGGAAHGFVNVTQAPASQFILILPSLDATAFFTKLGEAMLDGKPDPGRLATFGRRWGVEFLGPPLKPA